MAKSVATVMDNAEYAAAKETLTNLETRLSLADKAYREAVDRQQEHQRDAVVDEARQLISGGVVEAVATLADLQHDIHVLTKAVEMQRTARDEARGRAFKSICEDAKPGHVAAVEQLLAAGEHFVQANEALKQYTASVLQRGDGQGLMGPLMDIGIDPSVLQRVNFIVRELRARTADYRK